MDVFRREKLHNFGKHILHKSIYLFVADTKFSRRIRFARTAQLRIADEHGVGMRREFDLGNDRNVPLGGVGHDLTDVLFGEISAVSARSPREDSDGRSGPTMHTNPAACGMPLRR